MLLLAENFTLKVLTRLAHKVLGIPMRLSAALGALLAVRVR